MSRPYTEALVPRFLAMLDEPGPKYVALSGGRTPRDFFELLASELRDRVPWDRVTLFQVDERCVPEAHPNSNWRQIRETILDAIPEARAHRMRADEADGAAAYESLIRDCVPAGDAGIPVFDLVLLGIGGDGHTASLFPGTRALEETNRLVVRNPVPQLGAERITLSYPILNAARHRWFIVRGTDRRTIVVESLAGRHPAGRIRSPEWFVEPEVVSGSVG